MTPPGIVMNNLEVHV